MSEPVWIDPSIVVQVHFEQLAEHGGLEGIRDPRLLDSALHRPKQLWAFSDPKPDIPALAGALAFGICRNHPFIDGNKRTSWVLCRTFLLLNGQDIEAPQQEKYEAVFSLAAGELSEEAFAQWLRERLVPRT